MKVKKIIMFFSIFFFTIFLFVYISARKENRNNYNFVITKINKSQNGRLTVCNETNDFGFANFDSYQLNVELKDSLVKKPFSKKLYFYRKDKITDKYFVKLILHESGTYPIDWQ